jgi:hypothetical protein
MRGGFGVRPSVCGAEASSAPARSALVAVLGLLLACSGDRIVVAQEQERPGSEGDEAGGSDAVGSAGQPGVALLETCPPSPGERRALLGCWPTRHIGNWLGFFIGVPRYETLDGTSEEFPTGDVLMRVALDGTGELRFGEPASTAEPDPCAGVALSECPELGRVRVGFDYRLDEMEFEDADRSASAAPGAAPLRGGERMSFRIRLGEPWEGRCAEVSVPGGSACESGSCAKARDLPPTSDPGADDPACRCSGLGCVVRAPSLHISLRMSEDALALRGVYTPDDGRVPEARLEFLKVRDP